VPGTGLLALRCPCVRIAPAFIERTALTKPRAQAVRLRAASRPTSVYRIRLVDEAEICRWISSAGSTGSVKRS
jgi:hypothetical protein